MHHNESPGDYYSQLNEGVCGALSPEEPPDSMWKVHGKWTLASLLLETKTESIDPEPWSCTIGPMGCEKGTELCRCSMGFPHACVCVDDRRERARNPSLVLVLLTCHRTYYGYLPHCFLEKQWLLEAAGKQKLPMSDC
jgi:hypothetical protein